MSTIAIDPSDLSRVKADVMLDPDGGLIATPSGVAVAGALGGSFDKYYRHIQNSAATVWLIIHGLSKRPSVTVTDSAGTRVITEIQYIDNNSLYSRSTAAFSGYAECN